MSTFRFLVVRCVSQEIRPQLSYFANIGNTCSSAASLLGCSTNDVGVRFRQRSFSVKRRFNPWPWWPKKEPKSKTTDISKENKEFLEQVAKETYSSPVVHEPIEPKKWTETSVRCGLIARKIGVYPMWKKNGQRVLTTLLQVNDNHVIRRYSAEEYAKKGNIRRRWHAHGCGVMVVGAEGSDPQNFTAQYCGLFTEAGVAPKKKLTFMYATEDALLSPGTPLSVNHFRPGNYVDVFGLSTERGFQGVMKRWKFKGLPERNTTKAHRRPGSIGVGRKRAGPYKGTKMAGHTGSAPSVARALKIWRINTKYNVIYVNGPAVPGSVGNWLYIYDCRIKHRRPILNNPPPFPTYIPGTSEDPLPEDLYDPEIHAFEDQTIVFVETEDEKKAARIGAKLAKIRTKKTK